MLESKSIKTIAQLRRFAERPWYAPGYSGVDGQMAREIDILINGQIDSTAEQAYEILLSDSGLSARSVNALSRAQFENVGQLILTRRSLGKKAFRDRLDRIPNIADVSAEEICEFVEGFPQMRVTLLSDMGFPARALISLIEYEQIKTYEQLLAKRHSLADQAAFRAWLKRLPNVGNQTVSQIEEFITRNGGGRPCAQLLLDF
ncbi:MAG: hypothetical protein KF799_11200 [Bdellovibrionales bacterium]|nr:hypothetical protein [Bdellovibrionales bacterium]